jgi:hypothetical protein
VFVAGDIEGTPRNNLLLIVAGSLLASVIGTTGRASCCCGRCCAPIGSASIVTRSCRSRGGSDLRKIAVRSGQAMPDLLRCAAFALLVLLPLQLGTTLALLR